MLILPLIGMHRPVRKSQVLTVHLATVLGVAEPKVASTVPCSSVCPWVEPHPLLILLRALLDRRSDSSRVVLGIDPSTPAG
jgi:hypothetical protein